MKHKILLFFAITLVFSDAQINPKSSNPAAIDVKEFNKHIAVLASESPEGRREEIRY